jgi:DNA-binding NarL/FixJ family response regulator
MLTVTRAVEPGTVNGTAAPHPRPQPIRLLVVDDHPAVRLGLVQLLEGQRDFTVEAVCVNGEGAVAQAEQERIDVAVVDYHLGGRNGLWVCRALKRTARPPRVIIFSAFANDHLGACAAVAGADAVLNKGVLGSELCDAVRAVARGRRLLARVAPPMADMLRSRLGDAEQPLFGMLLAGIPRSEIGQTLSMSAHELASREGAILRKLESLPGEVAERRRGPDRIDVERLIRQRRAADFRRPATT